MYPNRLRVSNITTLVTKRLRADLLEVFKIFNRLESILPADFFDTDKTWYATVGHPCKITKMHSRLYLRK